MFQFQFSRSVSFVPLAQYLLYGDLVVFCLGEICSDDMIVEIIPDISIVLDGDCQIQWPPFIVFRPQDFKKMGRDIFETNVLALLVVIQPTRAFDGSMMTGSVSQ